MLHQKAVMENAELMWCKAPRRNWILLIYACTLKCVFWLCDMTLPSMGDSPSFPLLISYIFSQFLQLEDSKLGISCPFLPLYLLGWSWSPAGGSIQFFSKTQLIVFPKQALPYTQLYVACRLVFSQNPVRTFHLLMSSEMCLPHTMSISLIVIFVILV